jgi:cytoskeletal protein CcmA (bactofilin family)
MIDERFMLTLVFARIKSLLRLLGLVPAGPAARSRYKPPAAPTVVGADIRLKGELQGEGPVVMLGHFEGEIVLSETLHVGPDAEVDANISAAAIVVAGVVRGNLSADTRVEILAQGSLTGTVRSVSFAAADGASVKGEIWIDRGEPRAGGAVP